MNDQSPKSDPMTSQDTHNATSSQELAAGHSPCNSQDGMQLDLFGQALAPVSHSQARGSKKAKTTSDICGQCGSSLSVNPDRLLCLENKCSPQYAMVGGMMWPMIWKEKVTPRGRKVGQLVVSAHPISGIDCGLWATPVSNPANGEPEDFLRRKRESVARGNKMGISLSDLQMQAKACCHAFWATPNTMDHLAGRSTEAMKRQFETTRKGRTAPSNLREQVNPAMWPTPREFMYKDAKTDRGRGNIGEVVHGLTAQTENKGSLNPQFPCWLMGYPQEWLNCVGLVTPSSRKSRQSL